MTQIFEESVADAGNAYLLHAPCAGRSLKALAARLLGHARILKGEVEDGDDQNSYIHVIHTQ